MVIFAPWKRVAPEGNSWQLKQKIRAHFPIKTFPARSKCHFNRNTAARRHCARFYTRARQTMAATCLSRAATHVTPAAGVSCALRRGSSSRVQRAAAATLRATTSDAVSEVSTATDSDATTKAPNFTYIDELEPRAYEVGVRVVQVKQIRLTPCVEIAWCLNFLKVQ